MNSSFGWPPQPPSYRSPHSYGYEEDRGHIGKAFVCTTDKRLTATEFEALQGSNIHALMMRNRLILKPKDRETINQQQLVAVLGYKIEPLVRDLWYIDASDLPVMSIMVLNRSDAAAIRLALHDWTMTREEAEAGERHKAEQDRQYFGY